MEVQCNLWSARTWNGWHHCHLISIAQNFKCFIQVDKSYEDTCWFHCLLYQRFCKWIYGLSQARSAWTIWQGRKELYCFIYSNWIRTSKDRSFGHLNWRNAMDLWNPRIPSSVQDSNSWRRTYSKQVVKRFAASYQPAAFYQEKLLKRKCKSCQIIVSIQKLIWNLNFKNESKSRQE